MRCLAYGLYVIHEGSRIATLNACREAGEVLGPCCTPVCIIPTL